MSAPRVLLCRLSIRESSEGTPYLSGYLGCARVVAFKGRELDKFGNEVWEVFLAENDDQQRQELPTRGRSTWRATELPEGQTREYRNERRDPREDRIRELSERFEPDTEPGF